MRSLLPTVFIAAILTGPGALAQMQGDVERGANIAQRWCSSCHLVTAEGVASDTAPPFYSIAIDPDLTDANIRDWLISPHGLMPTFDLSEDEVRDIVAYIGSIRREEEEEEVGEEGAEAEEAD